MTIITTFISPYLIKFGWKFAERFVNKESNKKLRTIIRIKTSAWSIEEHFCLFN